MAVPSECGNSRALPLSPSLVSGEESSPVTISRSLRMETTTQLKTRFMEAFRRYSAYDAEMRRLTAESPQTRTMNTPLRLLSDAEREYRTVRLEYARRLLHARLAV